jgi:hypothetical protein
MWLRHIHRTKAGIGFIRYLPVVMSAGLLLGFRLWWSLYAYSVEASTKFEIGNWKMINTEPVGGGVEFGTVVWCPTIAPAIRERGAS